MNLYENGPLNVSWDRPEELTNWLPTKQGVIVVRDDPDIVWVRPGRLERLWIRIVLALGLDEYLPAYRGLRAHKMGKSSAARQERHLVYRAGSR